MSSSIASRVGFPSRPLSSHSRRLVRISPPDKKSNRSIQSAHAAFAAKLAATRARFALRHDVGRVLPEAFSTAGSRLPRARPSPTGSPVKHSLTFDFGGFAVLAATLESLRGRSPKPVIKSILKPSTLSMIAYRPVPACAGPIDISGSGLCKAPAEVYAAPWRSLPAQEWALDNLPINGLDRFTSQQIEKCELLADGVQSRRVQFADPIVSRRRIVSRWIVVRR